MCVCVCVFACVCESIVRINRLNKEFKCIILFVVLVVYTSENFLVNE